jgi:predicted ATPase
VEELGLRVVTALNGDPKVVIALRTNAVAARDVSLSAVGSIGRTDEQNEKRPSLSRHAARIARRTDGLDIRRKWPMAVARAWTLTVTRASSCISRPPTAKRRRQLSRTEGFGHLYRQLYLCQYEEPEDM